MTDAEWAALLEPVARRLLGDPGRVERLGETWRYGKRGSLAVHVGGKRAGTWRDHEAGEGGGTLKLIERELGTDKAGALRWLESERLVEARNGAEPPVRATRRPLGESKRPAAVAPPPKAETKPKPPKTAALVPGVLAALEPADGTPARDYLVKRLAWPPSGTEPVLPPTVRWLPRDRAPAGVFLPATAAGAVAFVRALPGHEPDCVNLEALTGSGEPLQERWRRTFGESRGRVFTARDEPGGDVWLAEGECDALALAVTRLGGCVRAVCGTAGFVPEAADDHKLRRVVLVPDFEPQGRKAADTLSRLLQDAGRDVSTVLLGDADPADALKGRLTERAGIRQFDGGEDPAAALAHAWDDVLRAVGCVDRLFDLGDLEGPGGLPKETT